MRPGAESRSVLSVDGATVKPLAVIASRFDGGPHGLPGPRWVGVHADGGVLLDPAGFCQRPGLWCRISDRGNDGNSSCLRYESVARGRCQTLGLWFEQVVREDVGAWVYGSKQVCQTPGKMSHPGFTVSKQVVGRVSSARGATSRGTALPIRHSRFLSIGVSYGRYCYCCVVFVVFDVSRAAHRRARIRASLPTVARPDSTRSTTI